MARPKAADPLIQVQGRVPASQKSYLALWSSEEGAALREMIERCQKMWPTGPFSAGGSVPASDAPKKVRKTPAMALYAKKHGLSLAEVENMAWQAFLKSQQQGGD